MHTLPLHQLLTIYNYLRSCWDVPDFVSSIDEKKCGKYLKSGGKRKGAFLPDYLDLVTTHCYSN